MLIETKTRTLDRLLIMSTAYQCLGNTFGRHAVCDVVYFILIGTNIIYSSTVNRQIFGVRPCNKSYAPLSSQQQWIFSLFSRVTSKNCFVKKKVKILI